MKPLVLLAAGALLLSSCSLFEKGEYTPLYLTEPSPLDPPGTDEARAAMRAERVKEGTFKAGDTPEVQQGRAYLLYRNPDYDNQTSGRMVETTKVKVISCEGTYYFVETDDGKRGFLRESDMVNPETITLIGTTDLVPMPVGEGLLPGEDGILPFEQAPLSPNAEGGQVRTDNRGRNVVIVGRRSNSQEFEARRRALESGVSMDGTETATPVATPAATTPSPAAPSPVTEDDDWEELPEPSGSGN